MATDRYGELVDSIFDKSFQCTAAPVYLDAGKPAPTISVSVTPKVQHSVDGVRLTVSNSNEQNIMERMSGHIAYTGEEKEDRRRATTPIDVTIPISHMAEILGVSGTFTLKDPREASVINDILDEYLVLVADKKVYEPHFNAPPQEDIDKLNNLNVAIYPLSRRLSTLGLGQGTWAEIEALFTRTGNYVIGGNNDSFITEPETPTPVDNKTDYSRNPMSIDFYN